MVTVDLRIDELVLHGFAPGRRVAIGDAVRHELRRVLAERATRDPQSFARWQETAEAPTMPTIRVAADASDMVIGARIARAALGALDGARAPRAHSAAGQPPVPGGAS